jgi:hypothetical protein
VEDTVGAEKDIAVEVVDKLHIAVDSMVVVHRDWGPVVVAVAFLLDKTSASKFLNMVQKILWALWPTFGDFS